MSRDVFHVIKTDVILTRVVKNTVVNREKIKIYKRFAPDYGYISFS